MYSSSSIAVVVVVRLSHRPIVPSSHRPIVPSSRRPIVPSSHHPIVPSSHLPIFPSSHPSSHLSSDRPTDRLSNRAIIQSSCLVGEADFDIQEFIMQYGTWEGYSDSFDCKGSAARGKIKLKEEDIRRCSRNLVIWHLSTPRANCSFKLNHLLNERYFSAHELRPSP